MTEKSGQAGWRSRVADEFREQCGMPAKVWWTTRFTMALLTLGNWDFGVAAMGNDAAKMDRAVRKATASTRRDADDRRRDVEDG